MNTLISGGTGMIGRALTESLLKDGHAVWILTRKPLQADMPEGAEKVTWDGQTTAGWGDRMEKMDAVVHLAGANLGALPWSPRVRAEILSSRVDTGRALAEAVRVAHHKPAVFFQMSGSGHYGPSQTEVMTEESPPGNDFQAEVTQAWEAATQPVADLGVRYVVARTAPVLDAGEGALPRLLLPFKMMVGGPLGSGRQWFSWIHLSDLIAAIRFLLDRKDAAGVFNVSAPNPLPNRDVAQTIGRVMRRPAWFPTPALPLRAALGEMSNLVLEGQKVLPCRLLEMDFHFEYPEMEGAIRDLLGKKSDSPKKH